MLDTDNKAEVGSHFQKKSFAYHGDSVAQDPKWTRLSDIELYTETYKKNTMRL